MNGNFGGGDGTAANPYLVEDAYDLNAVRNDLSGHYKQVNDIDFNGTPWDSDTGWDPIGNSTLIYFTGTYDGNDKKIYNLYVNNPSGSFTAGLFGHCYRCTIKNVHLLNVNIVSAGIAGMLIGRLGGINVLIDNCSAEGIVNSNLASIYSASMAGGLIGQLDRNLGSDNVVKGLISNSYSAGIVNGKVPTNSDDYGVGGFVGLANGNSTSDQIKIVNCYSSCNVNNIDGTYGYAGGFAGVAKYCVIEKCYSTGVVTGKYSSGGFVGGISGYLTVRYCFSKGTVIGNGSNSYGGFIGITIGSPSSVLITNCYSRCSVTNNNNTGYVGGFIGYVSSVPIAYCYATGLITTSTSAVGGFSGSGNVMTSCLWDIEATGINTDKAIGTYGKTTAEMKQKSTYQALGWVI